MRPALLASLPTMRWRARSRQPLVSEDVRKAAPALEADFALLERELLPRFYEFDEGALRAQNSFRITQLFVIVGGALTASLGAVQAALGAGITELGIVQALLAGALAAVVAYMRGIQMQREYFTMRLKAEQLRTQYFLFLGRSPPYDQDGDAQRLEQLREQLRLTELEQPA